QIEVEGPTGKLHYYPAGTDTNFINKDLSQRYAGELGLNKGQLGALSPVTGQSALPRGGQATPATGAVMPSMQKIPDYLTSDDWLNIGLASILPRGTMSIIRDTPGHQMRTAYGKKIGEDMAQLEESQRAGLQVLQGLRMIGETANSADDATLNRAIGPFTSNKWFQGARRAAFLPADLVMDPHNVPYDASYNLNNILRHDTHGLVTTFMKTAAKGMNMSDARQEAFADTMGAMLNATNRDDFNRILKHAEWIIRDSYGLPDNAMPPGGWRNRNDHVAMANSPAAGGTPAAPRPQRRAVGPSGQVMTKEWDGQQWVVVPNAG